jgi:hypothetical protein
VVTNKGEGIRRLIDVYHVKAEIDLGDDVSDTDAFRMLRAAQSQGDYMTLPSARCMHTRIFGLASRPIRSLLAQRAR